MHPDGASPVVPFIYDMSKRELKVATARESPGNRISPFLSAVNATLSRINEYNVQTNMVNGELNTECGAVIMTLVSATGCTIFPAISEIMRSDYL